LRQGIPAPSGKRSIQRRIETGREIFVLILLLILIVFLLLLSCSLCNAHVDVPASKSRMKRKSTIKINLLPASRHCRCRDDAGAAQGMASHPLGHRHRAFRAPFLDSLLREHAVRGAVLLAAVRRLVVGRLDSSRDSVAPAAPRPGPYGPQSRPRRSSMLSPFWGVMSNRSSGTWLISRL
jgi:hypothetical protein